MTEKIRETYFLVVRVLLILVMEIYIVITQEKMTGASYRMLLLLALFLGCMVGKEMLEHQSKWIFYICSLIVLGLLIKGYGMEYSMLGMLLAYDVISCFQKGFIWYMFPLLLACIPTENSIGVQWMLCIFLGIIYIQHDAVIGSYDKRMKEDTAEEEQLKRSLYQKELAWKEERKQGLLAAENQMLEEKSRLSQMLHDKLGHNINGSVYQLEAVKVLMEQDTETSRKMIQAVIDNLRNGMDEIRAILRKERPEKYKLALLQLQKLCEDCQRMGVETDLQIEGELSNVSEKHLEIILDNAFEAVSNSLKYAKCSKIEIKIHVMNQMLRCRIADNGIGCGEIIDGMGISGMRNRVRSVNGILDFDTEMGFAVNILIPIIF